MDSRQGEWVKMQRINENQVFLKATTQAHTSQGRALLVTARKTQLDAVCEVLLNIVHGTIRLSKELIKKAARYKHVIRQIVTKPFSRKSRKELMIKYFGIVKKLISAALPVIGVAISGAQLVSSIANN